MTDLDIIEISATANPIIEQAVREISECMMTKLGWRWQALQTVRAMELVRNTNNIAWMDLLRLAVAHVPEKELKEVLSRIEDNDGRIGELWKVLHNQIPD